MFDYKYQKKTMKGGLNQKENSNIDYFIAPAILVERTQVHLFALVLATCSPVLSGLLTPGSQGDDHHVT